ncbi:hypothetical protein [Zymobacter sp. IVIA_5232.4 C2]|uniref:hypothetical protein n=1 Tax=Zymobacter sp. IVIA_5232.4 C2 TaxID=3394855 RepID=UPI0039C17788
MAGGWWLVAGGWWLVAGGWWLVAGGWWLVAGEECMRSSRDASTGLPPSTEGSTTEGRDSAHLKERIETHFWTPEYARYC